MQSRREGKRAFYKINSCGDAVVGEFIQLAVRGAREMPEHESDRANS